MILDRVLNEDRTEESQAVRIAVLAALLVTIVLMAVYINRVMPYYTTDWRAYYATASDEALSGGNIYDVQYFGATPWIAWLYIPFALISRYDVEVANTLHIIANLLTVFYVSYRLTDGDAKKLVPIMLSAPFLSTIVYGSTDWIALLGYVTPGPISLIFAFAKPQVGIGMVMYWTWHAYRHKTFIRTFAPVTILMLLGVVLYGPWPLHIRNTANAVEADNVLWPWTIAAGLVVAQIWLHNKEDKKPLAVFSTMVSPYMTAASAISTVIGSAGNTKVLWIVSILSWSLLISRFAYVY